MAIWTLRLEPHAEWTLPPAPASVHRTLYFFAGGELHLSDRRLDPGVAVALQSDAALPLRNGARPSELLLLQGRPIAEPVAHYGPFVMNTRSELQQAFADYQRTRFGGWPWPSDAPVHGPDRGRFARHADGRVEER